MYDFSEKKKEQELIEEKLLDAKQKYGELQMSEQQLRDLQMRMEEAKMEKSKARYNTKMTKFIVAAAAVATFVILPNTSASIAHAMEQIPVIGKLVEVVTFRDYEYESDKKTADIEVPKLDVVNTKENADNETEDSAAPENAAVQEKLEKTTEEINAEIQKITEEIISNFEASLTEEEGYKDVVVSSEILATTPEYFTLKLMCFEAAGSGYEWNHYYTIDLNTGERIQLKDLFKEDTDYITVISENIKEQMQAQMDADESAMYWLNEEMEEFNFKQITDETAFYLNDKGSLMICFNEGDVGPMSMGIVEFEIPDELLKDIRK
ncbi:MAG: DUF3298 domain-containing protein [Lachnospiraceae bacterium]|nr:DUF3298 domain-containing protein [Lachnospiraceae bacterium]